MKSIVAAAALALGCVSSAGLAQKPGVVRGAGAFSCANYVQAYDAYRPFIGNKTGFGAVEAIGNYDQYEAWIQGYLFGVDSWNKGQIKDFDRAAMQLWIYNYCQTRPLDLIANAALAFYKEIGGPTPIGGDR